METLQDRKLNEEDTNDHRTIVNLLTDQIEFADDVDNNQFNLAAPIGRLQIWIDNPKTKVFFSKGKALDISEVGYSLT